MDQYYIPADMRVDRKEMDEIDRRRVEAQKALDNQQARFEKLGQQLDHIHDAMMKQDGAENLLKLAQAEMIIEKIANRRFD